MQTVTSSLILPLGALALIGVSCGSAALEPSTPTVQPVDQPTPNPKEQATDLPTGSANSSVNGYGITYQRPDGNRFVMGKGQLPDLEPLDITLSGRPTWVVAAPTEVGSIWVAILDDGRAEAFHIQEDRVQSIAVEPTKLPPGMPPVLTLEDSLPVLLTAGEGLASELTHAISLNPPTGAVAYLTQSGDLVIEQNDEAIQIAVGALPDARLLMDESGRLLFLSDPTTRYGHGVLGDGIEAGSITLVETMPSSQVSLVLEPVGEKVIEGIAPIWADLNGDGVREIIVTESDAQHGAQIVVYDEQGSRMAIGPAIGRGFRWRHQLAVAPFGPNGELELAALLTPHIGGVVEFYRMKGDQLEIMAQVPGYSSHLLGSRNLDQAIAGDFDGDGRVELVVPNQVQEILGAVRRNSEGAESVWSLPLGGRLSTNLAAVSHWSGEMTLGAGREDGVLRLWIPLSDVMGD
jgi:hypothetical protein